LRTPQAVVFDIGASQAVVFDVETPQAVVFGQKVVHVV
jgi:hypothetical protein